MNPSTAEMVENAIKNLQERDGSSIRDISKYVAATFNIQKLDKLKPSITEYIRSAVDSGVINRSNDPGFKAKFKLNTSVDDNNKKTDTYHQDQTSQATVSTEQCTLGEPTTSTDFCMQTSEDSLFKTEEPAVEMFSFEPESFIPVQTESFKQESFPSDSPEQTRCISAQASSVQHMDKWKSIGIAVIEKDQETYVLFIDFDTQFIELIHLENVTNRAIVRACKKVFATHGVPSEICSKSSVYFYNTEFAAFQNDYGFIHIICGPKSEKFKAEWNQLENKIVYAIGSLLKGTNPDVFYNLLVYNNTIWIHQMTK